MSILKTYRGVFDVTYTVGGALQWKTPLIIPKIDITRANLNTLFNSVRGYDNIATFQLLINNDVNVDAFGVINRYGKYNPTNLQNYDTALSIFPLVNLLDEQITSSEVFFSYEGTTAYIRTGTYSPANLFFDGTNSYSTTIGGGLALGFGFTSTYGSGINCAVFIITSDNIVVWFNSSTIYYFNAEVSAKIIDFLEQSPDIPIPSTDPYAPGGETSVGGGTGDFNDTSDPINIPSLPSLSAVDTGLITLFNPSLSELKNLATYMWSSSLFDISTWQKLFADPMDAILGLSIVPVQPTTTSGTVTVGNISTGISMAKCTDQWIEVDCGTVTISERWGAYLDYAPYTKAEIYLPYCGIHPIAIDDIMSKTVQVVYHVDILSGACIAYVYCDATHVLYSFVGQCSSSIPVSANDFTNVINGVLGIAGSIGSMVATGGATAPMAVANLANNVTNNLKPSVEKSGSLSGTGGLMAIQYPYIILTYPKQAVAEYQNVYEGYPSHITESFSNLSGFTVVEECHLDGITATESELLELESLLKSGVIF